jgi:hypothetical protein
VQGLQFSQTLRALWPGTCTARTSNILIPIASSETRAVAAAAADGAYMDGFKEFLAEAAAAGVRAKPSPGAGADASGQGHLWRDWNGLKTKQRIALLGEMQKVRRV